VFQFRPKILIWSALLSLFTILGLCAGAFLNRGLYINRVRWHLSLALYKAARAVRPTIGG
jgi:hypothetical protein